jgi:protein-S-isoprenylcysteine O-methyltransferase Ste14
MRALDWLAALGLAALLPIPLYWLVIHPFADAWRRRGPSSALWVAVPLSVAIAWSFLFFFRRDLLGAGGTALWAKALGFGLMAVAAYIFLRVKKELGADRLVGKTELRGDGELRISGLYRHIRHPSYAAQMATMLGLCLLAATPLLWVVAVIWALLLNLIIQFEERELLARFGDAYRDYRARVPAFLPLGAPDRE